MKGQLNYKVMNVRNLPPRLKSKHETGSVLVTYKGKKIDKVQRLENGSLLDEVKKINKKIKLTRNKADKQKNQVNQK